MKYWSKKLVVLAKNNAKQRMYTSLKKIEKIKIIFEELFI